MGMKVRLGGEWRDITGGKVFKDGSWRNLVAIKVFAGGAWRDVANLTAPAVPESGGGGGTISLSVPDFSAAGPGPTVSANAQATPSGGLAPYTYAWSVISSSPAMVTISPTNVAKVSVSGNVEGGNISCVVRCVCTDALGTTAQADANGSLIYFDPGDLR